jgi:hypothetical protein
MIAKYEIKGQKKCWKCLVALENEEGTLSRFKSTVQKTIKGYISY